MSRWANGGDRPLALDLYCGAGGAGEGLHRAGFDVVGVDLKFQPRYPHLFIQGDALNPPVDPRRFDFVWASPTCQAHTSLKHMPTAKKHADLIPATRAMLDGWGLPYVMENVMGARAHLKNPTMLCGTMFGLGVDTAELQRHRLFETNWTLLLTPQCNHGARDTIGMFGGHARNRRRSRVIGMYGHGPFDSMNHKGRGGKDAGQPDFSVAQGRIAMDTPWMTMAEMSQAIPPAYSEYIARKWLDQR